ncbi:MAG TPA: hypothetical protein DEP72_07770 [Clostridiales bacterium]|nr:MAG: hypothetical protein A2Y18_06710 [Clostridiales bacterium GWD2_32_19]HCC08034.1 hypothetical protein [Clostridiales bacterium]
MIFEIFYSWQSDLPNKTNRGYIEKVIKIAIKKIQIDMKNTKIFEIDRDTKGNLGSPDIIDTIFSKIDDTDVFICDISIINNENVGRKTPNPNVMVELGYAVRSIGWEKIICLFNLKYGDMNDIPFDLRTKRILVYNSEDTNDKEKITKVISDSLIKMVEQQQLFNPIKDHLKGKIDYCVLELLKHIASIVYRTYGMSESLEKVKFLLDENKDSLEGKLKEDFVIIGFFAYKNLDDIAKRLDDLFSLVTSSQNYPREWKVFILKFRDCIRSFQWHISKRRENLLFVSKLKKSQEYEIVSGYEMNHSNPKHSYILLKTKRDGDKEVINAGNLVFSDFNELFMEYEINKSEVSRFADYILKVIEETNEWLKLSGNEFVLDPDYYHIGGAI